MRNGTEILLRDGRIVFLKNIPPKTVQLLIKEGSNELLEATNGEDFFDIRISDDIEKVLFPEKSIA